MFVKATVFLMAAGLALCRGDSPQNVTVDYAGRFVSAFPGPVAQNIKDSAGTQKIFNTVYDTGSSTYMVSYCDFPDDFTKTFSLEAQYQVQIAGLLKRPHSVLRSESLYKLGDIQGKQCIVDYPDINTTVYTRLFIIGNRYYNVGYVGPTGSESNEAVLEFVDSIRLFH